jgi:hypothetical protein
LVRDTSNQQTQRTDWDNGPKLGEGSEFNKEGRELHRRRKFGFMPRKTSAEDLPWIFTCKGNEKDKEKAKDKQ